MQSWKIVNVEYLVFAILTCGYILCRLSAYLAYTQYILITVLYLLFFSLGTYIYLYSIFQFVFIVCFVYAFDVMLCYLFIKRIMEYTEKSLQHQRSILINRKHQLHERCERKLSIMVDLLHLKHISSVVIENLGKLNHVFKLLMEVNQLTYWQSMFLRCGWEIIFT